MSAAPPIHDGLFEVDDSGALRLVGGYSPTSGRSHFPLLDTCPYSGATDVERVLLSDEGTLWAWTAVTAPPPGYFGPVPYGFGIVELPEGLRIVTRLTEPDPDRLAFGMPMRLVAERLPVEPREPDDGPPTTEVLTWSFAPAPDGPETAGRGADARGRRS